MTTPGEFCPDCGEDVGESELLMHGGVCKVCYDDFHFGEDDEAPDHD